MPSQGCAVEKKTSIGGQALIEGVMMRGPHMSAMAIRRPDGSVYEETWETTPQKWYNKTPVIRGVLNFIQMLTLGYKCLMKSSEIAGFEAEDDEDPSPVERWLEEKLGNKFMTVFNVLVMVLTLFLSVGLFLLLPSALVKLIGQALPVQGWVMTALEGLVKIGIFVLYLFLVTRLQDIRRVYQYHGAEHKTIACYEAREPLEVENVMKYPRFHPRCGTSFLLVVVVVSVLVNSFISWEDLLTRVAFKMVLLPLVVGISYEIIRLAGRHNNPLTRIISAPGLWLQNLTTFEPDASQVQVAIAAMMPCIPENDNDDNY